MTPIINLEGKVGLITGIANEKSISTGVAEACAQAGAKLIITYQNEKTRAFIEPVIHRLDVPEATEILDLAPGIGDAIEVHEDICDSCHVSCSGEQGRCRRFVDVAMRNILYRHRYRCVSDFTNHHISVARPGVC